jgi:hypothetical protein
VLGHANRTGAPDSPLPLTPIVGFLFLAAAPTKPFVLSRSVTKSGYEIAAA